MTTPNKTSPRVSVIIAVYNGEEWLEECLKSLWAQTLIDFEVIIVDDASIDNTWGILKAMVDPRLKSFRNAQNSGCSAARNRAAKKAVAPYIAILDVDDLALPKRLEKQTEFLDTHPDYAIVGSFFELQSHLGHLPIVKRPTSDNEIRASTCFAIPFLHSSVMIRAEAFNTAGGYEPNYSHGEDYRLFARILSKHKGANLDQVLVTKRETSNGLTFKISAIAHMRIGLHNRLYAARMLSPKMTAYIQAILSGLSIPLIRYFGINREKIRSLFPVRNKGQVHDHR